MSSPFYKTILLAGIIGLVVASAFVLLRQDNVQQPAEARSNQGEVADAAARGAAKPEPVIAEDTQNSALAAQDKPAIFHDPIDRPFERVTKKPFGLNILPGESPVPNDRFSGIHVGTDFEIFEGEEDEEIPVYALCRGILRIKTFASGYGGVAVQSCQLEGQDVSVIYGHLKLESIESKEGDTINRGQEIGILGQGHSEETDGVRKHLHLGIRAGLGTDIRGYIGEETEITDWYNVLDYIS